MEKQSAVAKKKASPLALPKEAEGAWGTENVTQEEVVIPKLLLMHGQSELVLDGQCSTGELIKSTDHVVLGKTKETVKVIPFTLSKTWSESELVGKKYEWREEYEWTPKNKDLAWEYEKNGTTWRRDKCYNFYALLVDELEKGECYKPIKLQFKRTSFKAGKQIAGWFSDCAIAKRPPATQTWEVGSELIKGEENSYFVFTTKMGEATKTEHLAECWKWYQFIRDAEKNNVSIKDDNVEEEAATIDVSGDDEY